MKIIIEGDQITIRSKRYGEHGNGIRINLFEEDGVDKIRLSSIKGILEIGNLPSIEITKDRMLIVDHGSLTEIK